MKKAAVVLVALVVVLLVVPAAFAQGGAPEQKAPLNPTTLALAAGFGVAIAAFGGGLGQGRIAAAACEGIARNPTAAGAIRVAMIIGLALIESLVIYSLVLAFILQGK